MTHAHQNACMTEVDTRSSIYLFTKENITTVGWECMWEHEQHSLPVDKLP